MTHVIRNARSWGASVLLLATLAACDAFAPQPCGPLFRVLQTAAVRTDGAGTTIVSAEVIAIDYQGGRPAEVGINVFGQSSLIAGPLQGHVLAVKIIDSEGADVMVPASIEPIAAGQQGGALTRFIGFTFTDSASFTAIRQKFLSNSLALAIETDDPSFQHLRIPIVLTRSDDFVQMVCK